MALILAGIVVVVQALRPLCTLAGQPCGVASRIAAMERRFFIGVIFTLFHETFIFLIFHDKGHASKSSCRMSESSSFRTFRYSPFR